MAEEMEHYRDLLDDAIGSSPPSSIDVDAVIAGERGRTRKRRAAAGASAAVVVAAIGLIVTVLPSGNSAPAAAHRGNTPAAAPTAAPTRTTASPSETATATTTLKPDQAVQLWADLKHSLATRIPDAKPLPPQQCGPANPTGTPLMFCARNDPSSALAAVRADLGARAPYYFASADVPATDGTRGLYVIIQQAGPQPPCPAAITASRCSTSIGPHGEQVQSITDLRTPGMPANATMNVVSVRHADGTEVIATAQNWPASADTIGTIDLKHPAAAVPELREIAITPQISLAH